MSILYHLTPASNVPAILREGLVPQIGERSALVGETVPAIFCFADLRELEDALTNWMADYFDEEEPLSLLRVAAGGDAKFGEGAGYEVVILSAIPAVSLTLMHEDVWEATLIEDAAAGEAPR